MFSASGSGSTFSSSFPSFNSSSVTAVSSPSVLANVKCYNCNQEGHLARNCHLPRVHPQHRACLNCGEPGHTAANCPHPCTTSVQEDMMSVQCYNCGNCGHMSRHCPHPNKKQRTQGACFKCNMPGHMARDCPYVERILQQQQQRREAQSAAQQQATETAMTDEMQELPPTANTKEAE